VYSRWISALPLMLATTLTQAAMSEEEMFFKGAADVNEGELRFLATAPNKPAHHHQNRLTIEDASLETGWVKLDQCHANIDAVPNLQIVYREDRIRDLRLTRAENIGRVWVQDHTVQMENIAPAAVLCIEADTKALAADGKGGHVLSVGPYMRRFLDGYYPMRVSMTVRLHTRNLRFLDITPPEQAGFTVHQSSDEVGFDTWFEGQLTTIMRFGAPPAP